MYLLINIADMNNTFMRKYGGKNVGNFCRDGEKSSQINKPFLQTHRFVQLNLTLYLFSQKTPSALTTILDAADAMKKEQIYIIYTETNLKKLSQKGWCW